MTACPYLIAADLRGFTPVWKNRPGGFPIKESSHSGQFDNCFFFSIQGSLQIRQCGLNILNFGENIPAKSIHKFLLLLLR
jgi:hypothetical protein